MTSRFLFVPAILAATAGFANDAIASSPDAQAPAAVQLGDHPAVVVARTMRKLDPNTFIVAHPARLQLLAASPAEKSTQTSVAAGR